MTIHELRERDDVTRRSEFMEDEIMRTLTWDARCGHESFAWEKIDIGVFPVVYRRCTVCGACWAGGGD